MTKWIVAGGLFILILAGVAALILIPAPHTANAPSGNGTTTVQNTQTSASLDDLIVVTSPLPNAVVYSPIAVTGKARGSWYFEASAPYILTDSNGKVLAQGHIDALGDWMTSDYVPFSAKIIFDDMQSLPTKNVTLIIKNDNPSGDPARDKELSIPLVVLGHPIE